MATEDASGKPPDYTCPPVSARRQATRDRLLDAAHDVFAVKGVHGASIEEICEAAGFTRGALYSNFADKEELTLALLERQRNRLLAQIDLTTITEDMVETIELLLQHHQPDREFYLIQSELTLHALREPAVARPALEANRALRGRLENLLTAGLARLGLEPVVNITDLAEAVLAISDRSVKTSYLEPEATDPMRLARVLLPPLLSAFTRPV